MSRPTAQARPYAEGLDPLSSPDWEKEGSLSSPEDLFLPDDPFPNQQEAMTGASGPLELVEVPKRTRNRSHVRHIRKVKEEAVHGWPPSKPETAQEVSPPAQHPGEGQA
jgi:hypothetical protein